MEFENKILSREIGAMLYDSGLTLGTAESCTGGHIAEAIVATPGASNYYKGSIISYVNDVKERLLGVDHQVIETHTAVSEQVAIQMVKGACKALQVDYAIAATGIAGPSGGTKEIPVGTIWLACGTESDVSTCLLQTDDGRDKNLIRATNRALLMLRELLSQKIQHVAEVEAQGFPNAAAAPGVSHKIP